MIQRPVQAAFVALWLLVPVAVLASPETLSVEDLQVVNDREVPEVCFTLSQDLSRARQVHFEDFVRIAPAAEIAVSARGRSLCLAGFDFAQSYKITLRAGLPSEQETALSESQVFEVYVPDRPASLGFRQSGTILPRGQAEGIPLTSVNVSNAALSLLRINDRNLIRQLQSNLVGRGLSAWDIRNLAEVEGQEVWSGSLDITGAPNRPVTTVVPLKDILSTLEPGLYVTVATDPDQETRSWEARATQWFVLSDLGLTSYRGEAGLWVGARSLDSAAPLAGVRLELIAHNNAKLGTAVTDDQGFAHFPAGLVRGGGGNRPHSLLAYGADDDFSFLDLTRTGLDLLDRGVAGRSPPGAVDGFLYTERGIYRPGETVRFAALLRDGKAAAVTDLPLTFVAWRPDGKEFRRQVLNDRLGGYGASLAIPDNAPSGPWVLTAHVDPEGPAIGRTDFTVADFVPPQIEADLTTRESSLDIGGQLEATVDARYLYGAPGGNLRGEMTLQLQTAEDPYPDQPGYRFGLVQEPFHPQLAAPLPFRTDHAGRAQVTLSSETAADTSHPLEAKIIAAVFDLAGRPVTREITRPVRHQAFAIGLRPRFDGDSVAEGTTAGFEVISLDPSGARTSQNGLEYVLFAEDYDFIWYQRDGRWQAETMIHDRRVTGGSLETDAAAPAEIATAVEWGRYRLEVFDPAGGIASSLRFSAGWWVDPTAADRPDKVEVTLDKDGYRPGETAKVFVKPPFAAEVSLVVADRGLHRRILATVPAEGATIEVPVAEDWTAGVYLLASAFSKAGTENHFLPRRAVGTAWLALEPGRHLLEVAIAHPDTSEPSREVTATLSISGLDAGEEAFVTLAAVDDGVLQITDYGAPDPRNYFLGQRLLGLTLHDLYGQLIDPRGDAIGSLRSGGDLAAKRHLGALPERSTKVVSLFSGLRPVGPDGTVEVPLALPDFNGRLRLMAVAWSRDRFGQAESTMTVRSPLIAQVTLPRFLAPGDQAELLVSLRNLDGPEGDYVLGFSAEGPVTLDVRSWKVSGLAPGAERRQRVLLSASGVGVGRLGLTLTGPGGFELSRSRVVSVRPANPVSSQRLTASLPAGERLTVTDKAFTGLRPETVTASLSVSSLPRFDIPGLLASLDRYPYGCVEQTTSRALPLLYVNALASATDGKTEASLRDRVQRAIYRLAATQSGSGAFGLWGPGSPQDLWLTAYALDFLTRAAEADYHVPLAARRNGLAWLKDTMAYDSGKAAYLAGTAYGHLVLARAGAGSLSDTRYFFETRWYDLPSDLARAQVAAALSWYGDSARARDGFTRLREAAFAPDPERADYGTPLRDLAAAVALMAESRQFDFDDMKPLVLRLADSFQRLDRPSTQEMVWLALAAHGFVADSRPMRLNVDGRSLDERSQPLVSRLDPRAAGSAGAPLITVLNRGERALYQTLSFSGVPEQPLPAQKSGFSLKRGFFNFDGTPLDLDQLRQNDSFVMTIEGESLTRQSHRALLVHLLPAGWEIEDIRLGEGVKLDAFPWLGQLSKTEQVEYRDDRFVAAIDLTPSRPAFRAAFIARAVTPGRFALPGGLVEDMYRPSLFARQARGEITVLRAED